MLKAPTNRPSNPILSLSMAAVVFAALAHGCSRCDGRPSRANRQRVVGSASTPVSTPAPDDNAFACRTDSDCPSLACGPCTPGEVVKKQHGERNCAVNPCLDARAVCGPSRVCVVNAQARKNPLVWCRACFALEFDKAKLCAQSQAEAECRRTVDETARTCDQEKCAKVRLDLEGQDPVQKRLNELERQRQHEALKRYNETRQWFDKAAKPGDGR